MKVINNTNGADYPYFGINEKGDIIIFVGPDKGLLIVTGALPDCRRLTGLIHQDESTFSPFSGYLTITRGK